MMTMPVDNHREDQTRGRDLAHVLAKGLLDRCDLGDDELGAIGTWLASLAHQHASHAAKRDDIDEVLRALGWNFLGIREDARDQRWCACWGLVVGRIQDQSGAVTSLQLQSERPTRVILTPRSGGQPDLSPDQVVLVAGSRGWTPRMGEAVIHAWLVERVEAAPFVDPFPAFGVVDELSTARSAAYLKRARDRAGREEVEESR